MKTKWLAVAILLLAPVLLGREALAKEPWNQDPLSCTDHCGVDPDHAWIFGCECSFPGSPSASPTCTGCDVDQQGYDTCVTINQSGAGA